MFPCGTDRAQSDFPGAGPGAPGERTKRPFREASAAHRPGVNFTAAPFNSAPASGKLAAGRNPSLNPFHGPNGNSFDE